MRGTMLFSKYEYTIKTEHKHNLSTYAKANKSFHVPFTFYEQSASLSRQIKLQNHEIIATYTFRKGNKIKAVHLLNMLLCKHE